MTEIKNEKEIEKLVVGNVTEGVTDSSVKSEVMPILKEIKLVSSLAKMTGYPFIASKLPDLFKIEYSQLKRSSRLISTRRIPKLTGPTWIRGISEFFITYYDSLNIFLVSCEVKTDPRMPGARYLDAGISRDMICSEDSSDQYFKFVSGYIRDNPNNWNSVSVVTPNPAGVGGGNYLIGRQGRVIYTTSHLDFQQKMMNGVIISEMIQVRDVYELIRLIDVVNFVPPPPPVVQDPLLNSYWMPVGMYILDNLIELRNPSITDLMWDYVYNNSDGYFSLRSRDGAATVQDILQGMEVQTNRMMNSRALAQSLSAPDARTFVSLITSCYILNDMTKLTYECKFSMLSIPDLISCIMHNLVLPTFMVDEYSYNLVFNELYMYWLRPAMITLSSSFVPHLTNIENALRGMFHTRIFRDINLCLADARNNPRLQVRVAALVLNLLSFMMKRPNSRPNVFPEWIEQIPEEPVADWVPGVLNDFGVRGGAGNLRAMIRSIYNYGFPEDQAVGDGIIGGGMENLQAFTPIFVGLPLGFEWWNRRCRRREGNQLEYFSYRMKGPDFDTQVPFLQCFANAVASTPSQISLFTRLMSNTFKGLLEYIKGHIRMFSAYYYFMNQMTELLIFNPLASRDNLTRRVVGGYGVRIARNGWLKITSLDLKHVMSSVLALDWTMCALDKNPLDFMSDGIAINQSLVRIPRIFSIYSIVEEAETIFRPYFKRTDRWELLLRDVKHPLLVAIKRNLIEYRVNPTTLETMLALTLLNFDHPGSIYDWHLNIEHELNALNFFGVTREVVLNSYRGAPGGQDKFLDYPYHVPTTFLTVGDDLVVYKPYLLTQKFQADSIDIDISNFYTSVASRDLQAVTLPNQSINGGIAYITHSADIKQVTMGYEQIFNTILKDYTFPDIQYGFIETDTFKLFDYQQASVVPNLMTPNYDFVDFDDNAIREMTNSGDVEMMNILGNAVLDNHAISLKSWNNFTELKLVPRQLI